MHIRSLKLALVLLLVVSMGGARLAWAQSTSSGTVAGTITDPSGAVIGGAMVSLTDTATNVTRTATTNASGRYYYADVTPGTYTITVAKTGFSTAKAEKQVIQVGLALTTNLVLQVGAANVVVEVSAVGNELQTMNATVGNTVPSIAIENLPSVGRDVNTFIELQPGVSAGGDVAGAVNDQSYFSLDGGNNSNDMDGSGGVYTGTQQNMVIGDPTGGMSTQSFTFSVPSGVLPTPADSVEEFKVNTAGQTADFNSSAGAEIQIVTKRGTSSFHGTAYEYYKDNNWSSNAWANNQNNWEGVAQCGAPDCGHIGLPAYHYSRFGGALGGPLTPKQFLGGKTFFFYNYEGFRYPNSETITRNVPSPALRLGLLTDASTGAIAYNLNNTPVTFNGVTYAANFGCAGAPGGTCDPLALGLNPLVSQVWSKYEPQSNSTCAGGQHLCDSANVLGFAANLSLPTTSNFDVARIDHDFGSKNHFMASWRYYKMNLASDNQVDIGGFFPGDTLGTPASQSSDPIRDWYLVAGLTTNITTNTTNDIHYSFLRNWWAWSRAGAPPQLPGLGGALELDSGQSNVQDLGPFNVDNQSIRRRFWDGHDNMFRDDISMLKGNHLFQFGGTYQHNWNYHQRNDSGGTINAFPVYELGNTTNGSGMGTLAYPCATTSTISTTPKTCDSLYANVLGVVSIASQMFARSGASLTLNPPLSNAFDQSTIPYYNVYFSDTWHVKPTLTFTYGLGYALEMPPVEAQGKQTVLVDAADEPLSTEAYLDNVKKAALAGQVYNPEMGFALVGNTANGLKYPYNPFYGEFSPRAALAWNPHFAPDSMAGRIFGSQDTVLRGGYGRQYGRTNGVVQVLVPLLGLGLEQPVACNSNLVGSAPGSWACGSSLAGTYSNGFRVGQTASATGGPTVPLISLASPTLPQPTYPGFNNTFSSNPEGLDPSFRASAIDAFDLTLQRQLSHRVTLELGYIGRRITHEYQPVELNPVPYMMTLGGQQFKQAYANVVLQYCGGLAGLAGGGCGGTAGPNPSAVTAQPFFEQALKGTGYCNAFSSCTAAVVANEGASGTNNLGNAQVWGIWSDLDSGIGCPPGGCTVVNGNVGAFNFPRSLQSTPIPSTCNGVTTIGCSGAFTDGAFQNASIGYGNYNAGFVSVKMADWRGVTMQSNFTWSKALGLGAQAQSSSVLTALDPFNLQEQYGRQPWDRKIVYNTLLVYQPPFYKGQSGFLGRALGGWTFSTVFAAGSGVPTQVGTTFSDYQGFGGCDGIGCGDYDMENAVPLGPVPSRHAYHCPGNTYSGFCSTQTNGFPVNYFPNGVLQASNWRNPILGIDSRDGGAGILGGLAYWNMDFSIKKSIRVTEGVSLEFQGVFANVLNHNQWTDNYLGLYDTAGFGALGYNTAPDNGIGVNGEAEPRNIELGARVRF
jgi:Carboxypeptidase regulatory-like domain